MVPFAALHDGQDWLLGRLHFTYLTSGTSLLHPQGPDPKAAGVVVFADPQFAKPQASLPAGGGGQARGLVFSGGPIERPSDLPGTRREAEAIAKILAGVHTYSGTEATKEALLSTRAPAILHVATHGIFESSGLPTQMRMTGAAPHDPLVQSALVMAQGALATALEVRGMNLWGTQLVVLSACFSGGGEVQTSEGVFGLRRSFFTAGAETLVTSLWEVNDSVAVDMMSGYYRRLAQGVGRVEAMDQVAQEIKQQHPHPYFWAPFIVLGRGDPLRGVMPATGR